MSTSTGGDDGLRWTRHVDTLAHQVGAVAAVVVVLVVAGWLAGPDVHDTLGLVATIIGLVWILARLGHDRREHLCVRCLRAMPTDPGAAVGRGRVWLWCHHRLLESPVWMAGYTVLLVLALLPGWLRWRAIDWVWIVPLAAMAWLSFHHHRLRPWCPYCRDWDDHGERGALPRPRWDEDRSLTMWSASPVRYRLVSLGRRSA